MEAVIATNEADMSDFDFLGNTKLSSGNTL